jgi:RNA polymerase sigma factor (sigma-70 family)
MQTPLFFLNDDAKLLDEIRNGNDQALTELFQKNRRPITSLVIRNQGSEDDAEDVLQEALVAFWEKVHSGSFEYQAKLSTYIYTIAKNIWLRRLIRQRRELHSTSDEFETATEDANPQEELEENERITAVQEAMEQIGNPCRDLLLLYYWEERSMEEIAVKLGFANANTVKSKKYQCKKVLEKMVQKALGGTQ